MSTKSDEEAQLQILKGVEEDSEWFFSRYDAISSEYKGKYVLVKEKKIVADGETLEKLQKDAEKKKIDIATSFVYFVPVKEVLQLI
jgi:hypothetical protein